MLCPEQQLEGRILGVAATPATPSAHGSAADLIACACGYNTSCTGQSCVARTTRGRPQRRRQQMTMRTDSNDSRGTSAGRAAHALRGRGRMAPPPPSTHPSGPPAHSLPLKSATASSRPARRIRTSARNTRPAAKAMPKPRTSQDSPTKIIAMAARTGTSSVNA